MKLLLVAFLLVASNSALADTVTCTLKSGDQATSANFSLVGSQQEDYVSANGIHDLNFHMIAECKNETCAVDIIIDSSILRDEAGSTGFEFQRSGPSREIFREPVENAPDGLLYEISCDYSL